VDTFTVETVTVLPNIVEKKVVLAFRVDTFTVETVTVLPNIVEK
jgi:hypothetical protein